MRPFSHLMSPTSRLFPFNITIIHYPNSKQKHNNHLSSFNVHLVSFKKKKFLIYIYFFYVFQIFSVVLFFYLFTVDEQKSGSLPPPGGMEPALSPQVGLLKELWKRLALFILRFYPGMEMHLIWCVWSSLVVQGSNASYQAAFRNQPSQCSHQQLKPGTTTTK